MQWVSKRAHLQNCASHYVSIVGLFEVCPSSTGHRGKGMWLCIIVTLYLSDLYIHFPTFPIFLIALPDQLDLTKLLALLLFTCFTLSLLLLLTVTVTLPVCILSVNSSCVMSHCEQGKLLPLKDFCVLHRKGTMQSRSLPPHKVLYNRHLIIINFAKRGSQQSWTCNLPEE